MELKGAIEAKFPRVSSYDYGRYEGLVAMDGLGVERGERGREGERSSGEESKGGGEGARLPSFSLTRRERCRKRAYTHLRAYGPATIKFLSRLDIFSSKE